MIRQILSHYAIGQLTAQEYLDGAGGFSGAEFWRIQLRTSEGTQNSNPAIFRAKNAAQSPTPSEQWTSSMSASGMDGVSTLCLRKWPREHPNRAFLTSMHALLEALSSSGLPVPAPLRTRDGATFLKLHDRLWELTPWLPGKADYQLAPSTGRLRSAMTTLAQLHVAAERWSPAAHAVSPAVVQRFEMLGQVVNRVQQILECRSRIPSMLQAVAERILQKSAAAAAQVRARHSEVCRRVLPLQWVVRDLWHDHVLFTGDRVTGIVDFGAIAQDTVALDIARLLASLAVEDREQWALGLDAYSSVRPLTTTERDCIHALDQAAVVLSGLNWLQWIAVDARKFPNREADIGQRLETLAMRMDAL